MDHEQADAAALAPELPPDIATPTAPGAAAATLSGRSGIRPPAAVFTAGSVLRHVLVMTGTGTIGVMAIFIVDLLSLLYVARLGQTSLTAAVGYASQVLFYPVSINIGITIGVTALIARAIGAGDRVRARRLATTGLVYAAIASATVAVAVLSALHPILAAIGAEGEVATVAARFLAITVPANVPLALGMVLSGVLRAVGDARRAMFVTLAGGLITGVVDPILIFGLHLGVYGAAISTVIARFTILGVGAWGVVRVHDLLGPVSPASLRADWRSVVGLAAPAVATNLATPVGNSYILHIFSRFGTEAIAATTVTDRLVPVAFGVLFALSGAVGPILGQNLGARHFDRVTATLTASFLLTAGYVLMVWGVLALASPLVVGLFGLTGEAAHYVTFFCRAGIAAWLFIGFLFVANASFNNLGFPWLSLLFNWGRATLGTIPFATLGVGMGGVIGGQLGVLAGAAIFGTGALVTAYRVVGRLAKRA